MSDLYSANLIIGKQLYAKKNLKAYNLPLDSDPNKKLLFTISAGNSAGVVDTYFSPKENRSNLWWGFYKLENGIKKYYYIENILGSFSKEALKQQGVITLQEETDKENEVIKTWDEKLKDILKTGFNYGLVIAGIFLVYKIIDNKKK